MARAGLGSEEEERRPRVDILSNEGSINENAKPYDRTMKFEKKKNNKTLLKAKSILGKKFCRKGNMRYAPIDETRARDISPASDINRQSAPTSNKIFPEPSSQPGGEKQRKNNLALRQGAGFSSLARGSDALLEINKNFVPWRNVLILL